jgi:hypothetical protein
MLVQVRFKDDFQLPHLERKDKILFCNEDNSVQHELEFQNKQLYSPSTSYIFDFDMRGHERKEYVKQFHHVTLDKKEIEISFIKKYL